MWQELLEQLKATGETDNLFWPEVNRDREYLMLEQLFTAAIEGRILAEGEAEWFLTCVLSMTTGARNDGSGLMAANGQSANVYAATRELLDMDEKLSPICHALFKKRLVAPADREILEQDLEVTGDLMGDVYAA